jgi:plastocyanin
MCAHHEKEDHGGYGNLTGVAWSILVMGLSLAAVIILWVWFGYIGPTFSEDVLANQQAVLREHFGLPALETSDNPEILQTPPSLRNVGQGQQTATAGSASATGAATTNATTNATSANATTTTNDMSQESGVETGETAAGTTIIISAGSSVQGNPDYEPDDAKVSLSGDLVWKNEDSVPHTATSGSGVEDPNSGKIFDTSIINGGEESSPVQLTGVKEGDEIPYYCQVHPFMTSKLTIVTSTTDAGANSSTNNTSESETGQELATNTSSVEGNTTSNKSQPLESSGNVSNP